jgi:hypothetical protein
MEGRIMPSMAGARAEAAVAAALVRSGFEIFLPAYSAHSRVDLAYLRDGQFVGVQCKTARLLVNDTLFFRTCSNTSNVPKPYGAEVGEFGVYSPDTGMVYLLTAAELPSQACCLRLTPTRNNQAVGVRWAKDYELGPP